MTKYIQGKNGKFKGSIGDGKTNVPPMIVVPKAAPAVDEPEFTLGDNVIGKGSLSKWSKSEFHRDMVGVLISKFKDDGDVRLWFMDGKKENHLGMLITDSVTICGRYATRTSSNPVMTPRGTLCKHCTGTWVDAYRQLLTERLTEAEADSSLDAETLAEVRQVVAEHTTLLSKRRTAKAFAEVAVGFDRG